MGDVMNEWLWNSFETNSQWHLFVVNLLPAVKPTSQPADTFDNMVSWNKSEEEVLLLLLLTAEIRRFKV